MCGYGHAVCNVRYVAQRMLSFLLLLFLLPTPLLVYGMWHAALQSWTFNVRDWILQHEVCETRYHDHCSYCCYYYYYLCYITSTPTATTATTAIAPTMMGAVTATASAEFLLHFPIIFYYNYYHCHNYHHHHHHQHHQQHSHKYLLCSMHCAYAKKIRITTKNVHCAGQESNNQERMNCHILIFECVVGHSGRPIAAGNFGASTIKWSINLPCRPVSSPQPQTPFPWNWIIANCVFLQPKRRLIF